MLSFLKDLFGGKKLDVVSATSGADYKAQRTARQKVYDDREAYLLEVAKQEAQNYLAGKPPEIPPEDISRTLVHLKTHWQRRYGLVEVG